MAKAKKFLGLLALVAGIFTIPTITGTYLSARAPVTDNFNRSDSSTLGANWTLGFVSSGGGDIGITSNAATPTASGFQHNVIRTAESFGNDQYSQIKALSYNGSSVTYMGPCVRSSGTPGSYKGYCVFANASASGSFLSKQDEIAGNTDLTSAWSYSGSFTDGDIVKLEVTTSGGNAVLKVYKNAAQVGSTVTDSSSPFASGKPGFLTYDTLYAIAADDFEGDTIGGGGGGVKGSPFNIPTVFRTGVGQRADPNDNETEPGNETILAQGDLTYLGGFRVHWDAGYWDDINLIMTGRRSGSDMHIFIQNKAFTDLKYSFSEVTAPTSGFTENVTTMPFATTYRKWNTKNGANYDISQGLWNKTFDGSGNLSDAFGNWYEQTLTGFSWTNESATCCLIGSYVPIYGTYYPLWNTLVTELTNDGVGDANNTNMVATTHGPLRFCVGQVPGNILTTTFDTNICGPMRSTHVFRFGDGTLAVGHGGNNFQQGTQNKGPSFFAGMPNINMSTTVGYGSFVDGYKRSTDIIPPDPYLALWTLDSLITPDTGIIYGGYPTWTMRRPPHNFGTGLINYGFESGVCLDPAGAQTNGQVDPAQYGGIGTATSQDGGAYYQYVGGTKRGVVALTRHDFGHTWYRTKACLDFHRDLQESSRIQDFVGNDNDIGFSVADALYGMHSTNLHRVRFLNNGANQSLSVSTSGMDVTVNLATNGSSVITSTANQVIAAINANGPAHALINVALSLEDRGGGVFLNDGTAAVLAFDYWKVAGGPLTCPNHQVESGVGVTGPVSTGPWYPVLMVYNEDDLPTNPIWEGEPEHSIYLYDVDPDTVWYNGTSRGIVFDSVTRRLYIMALQTGAQDGFSAPVPVIHVYQVAGSSAPTPTPSEVAERREAHQQLKQQAYMRQLRNDIATNPLLLTLVVGVLLRNLYGKDRRVVRSARTRT